MMKISIYDGISPEYHDKIKESANKLIDTLKSCLYKKDSEIYGNCSLCGEYLHATDPHREKCTKSYLK